MTNQEQIYLTPSAYDALVTQMDRGRNVEQRSVMVVFDPHDRRAPAALYSNASASDIEAVLLDVLERVRSGALRMPLSPDGVRWVDVGEV
jgi:hypothetical protein